ncbi:S-layer homology domain-containing protein [Paenibacillus harenae]|uniref:S-layer homology domain-containing protein n=1 Tax=Paenibacillus harenae TaxID=306543 RepID=UPI0003F92602|nr:S-layer homology domain-containing protein [Paenibacillus harenae]
MQKQTMKGFVLGFSTALLFGCASLTAGAASGAFKDIKAGAWYESAVLWAQEKGIVNGYPDGTFKPNGNVTRAELSGVVQNLAKEGYIDTGIPLEATEGYGKPTVTYEKFKAIRIGETTLKDLEKLYGQKLNYDLYADTFEIIANHAADPSIFVRVNLDQVVTSRFFLGDDDLKSIRYPQVTEQNYNKLENNMSYEFVSAILGGEGILVFDSLNEQIYNWYGTGDTYAHLVFTKAGKGLSLTLDGGKEGRSMFDALS